MWVAESNKTRLNYFKFFTKGKMKFAIILERLVAVFIFLGVFFKILHWPGAMALVLFGGIIYLLVVAFKLVRNFRSKWPNEKLKWGNFFTVISGVFIVASIIFFQQHYPYAKNLGVFGVSILVVAIILTRWRLALEKRHMVIAATFIFWSLSSIIYSIEHQQFHSEIHNQILNLRSVSKEKLNKNRETNNYDEVSTFCKTIDSSIVTLEAQIIQNFIKNLNIKIEVSYPQKINFGSFNFYEELFFFSDFGEYINANFFQLFKSTNKDLNSFLKKYEYQEGMDPELEIQNFFREGKIDHTFIFYAWFLEELKLNVLDYFFEGHEKSNFENLVINQNIDLNQNIKNFLYRQGHLRVSLIIATLFFILTLYINKVGVKIQFQKPLIFLGLFIFLEFILLTIDPFLQLQIENNYIISILEVGLAALIIPFHSMVEHNLYQNENQNEPERP